MKRFFTVMSILLMACSQPAATVEYNIKKPSKAECQMLLENLLQNLRTDNYCNHNSDCVSVDLGCPYPCDTLVNRNADIPRMKALKESHDNICPSCEANCSPPRGNPTCVDHQCVYQ
jgi:hypothetical protein